MFCCCSVPLTPTLTPAVTMSVCFRFNEFGRAVWSMQKEHLDSAGRGYDWRFCAFYDEENDWTLSEDTRSMANQISGRMYSD